MPLDLEKLRFFMESPILYTYNSRWIQNLTPLVTIEISIFKESTNLIP